jgi:hypothetical protein
MPCDHLTCGRAARAVSMRKNPQWLIVVKDKVLELQVGRGLGCDRAPEHASRALIVSDLCGAVATAHRAREEPGEEDRNRPSARRNRQVLRAELQGTARPHEASFHPTSRLSLTSPHGLFRVTRPRLPSPKRARSDRTRERLARKYACFVDPPCSAPWRHGQLHHDSHACRGIAFEARLVL